MELNLNLPKPTFCRVPINSILGVILGPYKKVGLGGLSTGKRASPRPDPKSATQATALSSGPSGKCNA